ncbi:hypothetical protein FPSE_08310 [Fusarium pseudograminearum CS3096]|uniref:BTB domain-containing protein n=1 Tax=Fusarium pseudograminearum (strain CS3096) TaxID=1028729 RepID=K3VC84_FUSPC|nr:hypothetical protein FPSE_08310 [Fusarium pseudograminearum CS3096]EKJ71497.1 hypothetical protein FPSE_08310 [Fusarium pseudograminearum CS3096]
MGDSFEARGDAEHHLIEELCTSSTLASFYNLLHDGENADITIVCGNREFKAHRAVVCAQSLWFNVAFTAPAKKRIIRKTELKGVDPDVFQRFLEFLYTGTYTVEGDTSRFLTTPSIVADIESLLKDYPGWHKASSEATAPDSPKRPVRRSSRLNSTAESMDETPDPDSMMTTESPMATGTTPNSSLPPESREAPFKTPFPPTMAMSLELYNLASEYNVPALQLLALERFHIAAKDRWIPSWEGATWDDTKEFEDVVLDLYKIKDDQPMWRVMILLIKAKASTGDDVLKRRMREVVKEHHDLAECREIVCG